MSALGTHTNEGDMATPPSDRQDSEGQLDPDNDQTAASRPARIATMQDPQQTVDAFKGSHNTKFIGSSVLMVNRKVEGNPGKPEGDTATRTGVAGSQPVVFNSDVVNIHGLGTSSGHVVAQPNRPAVIQPSNTSSSSSTSEPPLATASSNVRNPAVKADHDIYYEQLLGKRRGSPMWIPGPNLSLPIEYRREGVRIGDVGILYRCEGFSFLFNIYLPADHPINIGRVPDDFKPLDNSKLQHETEKHTIFSEDHHVASSCVRKVHASELFFESSATEGAILVMPNGAAAEDLMSRKSLRKYVAENAESWYKFVTEVRERQVENGDIRLVTGFDKVSTWGIATFASNVEQQNRLEFTRTGLFSSVYKWNCIGNGSGRVGPHQRELEDLGGWGFRSVPNQCIFLRTMSFDFSREMWDGMKVRQIQSSDGFSGPAPPSNQGDTNRGGHQSSSGTGSSGGQLSSGCGQSGSGHGVTVHAVQFGLPVVHPANYINRCLLEKHPKARIVITEDEDWMSTLAEVFCAVFPGLDEVCSRVLAIREISEEDGIVTFKTQDPIRLENSVNLSRRLAHDALLANDCSSDSDGITPDPIPNLAGSVAPPKCPLPSQNQPVASSDSSKLDVSRKTAFDQGESFVIDKQTGPPVVTNSPLVLPFLGSSWGKFFNIFTKKAEVEDLSEDDNIIVLMGPTGSGKSSFIEKMTGTEGTVHHGLTPQKAEISVTKLSIPKFVDADIHFVDTPGFDSGDGTFESEAAIFDMISKWLDKTYRKNLHVAGLLYFHPISERRLGNSALRNLMSFKQLCGPELNRVILTTTMWDTVDESTAIARESELCSDFWAQMIKRGSLVKRFYHSESSARDVLAPLFAQINRRREDLLNETLDNLGEKLKHSMGGLRLFTELEECANLRQDRLARIRKEQQSPSLPHGEYHRLMGEFEKACLDLQELMRTAKKTEPDARHLVEARIRFFENIFQNESHATASQSNKNEPPPIPPHRDKHRTNQEDILTKPREKQMQNPQQSWVHPTQGFSMVPFANSRHTWAPTESQNIPALNPYSKQPAESWCHNQSSNPYSIHQSYTSQQKGRAREQHSWQDAPDSGRHPIQSTGATAVQRLPITESHLSQESYMSNQKMGSSRTESRYETQHVRGSSQAKRSQEYSKERPPKPGNLHHQKLPRWPLLEDSE